MLERAPQRPVRLQYIVPAGASQKPPQACRGGHEQSGSCRSLRHLTAKPATYARCPPRCVGKTPLTRQKSQVSSGWALKILRPCACAACRPHRDGGERPRPTVHSRRGPPCGQGLCKPRKANAGAACDALPANWAMPRAGAAAGCPCGRSPSTADGDDPVDKHWTCTPEQALARPAARCPRFHQPRPTAARVHRRETALRRHCTQPAQSPQPAWMTLWTRPVQTPQSQCRRGLQQAACKLTKVPRRRCGKASKGALVSTDGVDDFVDKPCACAPKPVLARAATRCPRNRQPGRAPVPRARGKTGLRSGAPARPRRPQAQAGGYAAKPTLARPATLCLFFHQRAAASHGIGTVSHFLGPGKHPAALTTGLHMHRALCAWLPPGQVHSHRG